ncbi:site-specific tyrosine recombinase XerC [Oceanobacillus picturae]|uniref:Site-specific tyrosine recombinase XerC n=1 Tax=Oceanobacillus picturae TaxID=171693 RepID=W9AFQ3_9BACI|nr:site-specific integrase [Oceanobacillus picturae]CDO04313.1 site-specific tyrosine recombinase XerC [Oceanobacillus picturae]
MKVVEPIRDLKQLEAVKGYLRGKNKRDYLLFMVGISSALRISDILKLKVKHVWSRKKVESFIELNEKKTGKYKRFPITSNLSKAINEYMKEFPDKEPEDFLFASRKGLNKPISRQYAATMLNEACDMVGIAERFGTHGLRKTWGFFAFKKGISLDYICIALNHSSVAETKRYLGILQDDLDNLYLEVNL